MRAVVQRTRCSKVLVNEQLVGQAGPGLTVLLGIKRGDQISDAEYMIDKIINLRIFEDDEGKMNRSLLDCSGDILLVSQFTLYGDARRGRRPGFSDAELPELAQPLFEKCLELIRAKGIRVETGIFGEHMVVTMDNDGPCTIILDSDRNF
ncbi:MAG: D-aminoacyl-tRNA deacylase [Syntrophomonadaceae bacterium]|jgi:D-tyrosyl-tRNA(Tyr) deacylase|nr:D-aminoacyl-tRNA deacylase [Bacillota bacterium]NLP24106.1 D-tyrosyl-tRNA(Tyr) deacylase [Syntrophomonadaceae bacterium]